MPMAFPACNMSLYVLMADCDAQGGVGARDRSQLDDKTMPWATFAQRCVATDGSDGGALTLAITDLATSLAKQTPFMIRCDALRVQVCAQPQPDNVHSQHGMRCAVRSFVWCGTRAGLPLRPLIFAGVALRSASI